MKNIEVKGESLGDTMQKALIVVSENFPDDPPEKLIFEFTGKTMANEGTEVGKDYILIKENTLECKCTIIPRQ